MANTLRPYTGSIVYSFATPREKKGKTLYVNVVPDFGCTNSCRFCGRKDAIAGKPNIYEQKAGTDLYLNKAPSVEKIMRELKPEIKKPFLGIFGGTKEIAFVGLGEPLLQFDLVCETIRALRYDGFKGKIRIDTNGLVKLTNPGIWFGCSEVIPINHARKLAEAGLTDICVSVNAVDSYDYGFLCRPQIKGAFDSVCSFVRDCKREGIHTSVSFVVGFKGYIERASRENRHEFFKIPVKTRSEKEYREFAKRDLRIKPKDVIIREFIPPIAEGNQ